MNPINSSNSPYVTNLLKGTTPPPPIQIEENGLQLNYSLTIPESLYLAFMKKEIQSSLNQRFQVIYLGTSAKMQSDFSAWVTRTIQSRQFTPAQLDLVKIVSSIWMKTKIQVDNELIMSQNQETIADEKKWKTIADDTLQKLYLQGISGGKALTTRQANFLITAADNIVKTVEHMRKKEKK